MHIKSWNLPACPSCGSYNTWVTYVVLVVNLLSIYFTNLPCPDVYNGWVTILLHKLHKVPECPQTCVFRVLQHPGHFCYVSCQSAVNSMLTDCLDLLNLTWPDCYNGWITTILHQLDIKSLNLLNPPSCDCYNP